MSERSFNVKIKEILKITAVFAVSASMILCSWTLAFANDDLEVPDESMVKTVAEEGEELKGYVDRSYLYDQFSSISTFSASPFSSTLDASPLNRIAGEDRYRTSYKVADEFKSIKGQSKLDSIIVAYGEDFADAISASYLAKSIDAPIILSTSYMEGYTRRYIEANVKPGGTVYIVGGRKVISSYFESSLKGYKVVRYGGQDRHETNIQILNASDTPTEGIFICSSKNFPDGLSASATGLPVLVVGDSFTIKQYEYLKNHSGMNIYIAGGPSVVNKNIENLASNYGTVKRIYGSNRFETSYKIANEFYSAPEGIILASALDFPDALVGGPIAYKMGIPLLLTSNISHNYADAYMLNKDIDKSIVLGGPTIIKDHIALKNDMGIDVSVFNLQIDWKAVKNDGVDFAFIRAGGRYGASGKIYYDDFFDYNMKNAGLAGIDRGVYFFTQAITPEEAVAEADYTISLAKKYNVELPIVIDTENLAGCRHSEISVQERTDVVKAFCEEVKRQGYTPMIYSNLLWLENQLDMSQLSGYKVWVAQYYDRCTYDGDYDYWQYTSSGSINGIKTKVDMNMKSK